MAKNHILAFACIASIAASVSLPVSAASVADLAVSLAAPPTPRVDDVAHYAVNVANIGNRNADGVQLSVQLPATHTSPGVFVLGDLSQVDPRCTRVGTALTCTLGRINRGSATVVSFDLALPYSSAPLVLNATASTTTAESVTTNNLAQLTAAVSFYSNPVVAPQPVEITSCTGTNLTSFFECTVYSGATQTHQFQLEANGTVTLYGTATVVGTWTQPSADTLTLALGGSANFSGRGVDLGCFEGVTTFTNSPTYVSPYRVCPF